MRRCGGLHPHPPPPGGGRRLRPALLIRAIDTPPLDSGAMTCLFSIVRQTKYDDEVRMKRQRRHRHRTDNEAPANQDPSFRSGSDDGENEING